MRISIYTLNIEEMEGKERGERWGGTVGHRMDGYIIYFT